MTDTAAAAGLTPQQWDDEFFTEYVQNNRFASEMGDKPNNIIQVKEDLTVKKGDSLTFALLNRLVGAGVTGTSTLVGNEEEMVSRSFKLTVILRRNAVVVPEQEEQFSSIPLRGATTRDALMEWAMENTRDRIITALGSINGVAYASATEGQKDAWLTDNADRVLFGALKSNTVTGDQSASLLNIDTTDDKFDTTKASLMKRLATSANPKIKPVRVEEASGKRFYVIYCDTLTFRDLQKDPVITQAQREVMLRMQNIKLFEGGDLEWDGLIFKEIDDIASLGAVGNGGSTVSPVYLCGAQAIGYALSKRWQAKGDVTDYGDKVGAAIREIANFGKMLFGTGSSDTADLKDHGIVTGFMSATADA